MTVVSITTMVHNLSYVNTQNGGGDVYLIWKSILNRYIGYDKRIYANKRKA